MIWILLLALIATAIVGHLLAYPSPDVAWNLYATGALLDGARLGVDLFENTPPMIFAIKAPVVAAARAAGTTGWSAWAVVTALAAGLSVLLVRHVLIRTGVAERLTGWRAVVVAAAVLLVVAGQDYGQRDHLTAILVLPYLALAIMRLHGGKFRSALAVGCGALAAVGIGIKPHFALLPAVLIALQAKRVGIRQALPPEHIAVGSVGVAYVLAVWVAAPEYLDYAATYGPLYQSFRTNFGLLDAWWPTLPAWLSVALGAHAVPAYVALGAFAAMGRELSSRERSVAEVLALATGVLLLAAILQAKGWRYHFLPATLFGVLLLALLVSHARRHGTGGLARAYLAGGVATVTALAGAVLPATALRAVFPRHPVLDVDSSFSALLPLVQSVGPSGHVAVLSSNIASPFPLVLAGGARWTFRHPNFWPLVALYPDQVRAPTLVIPRPADRRGPLELRFIREVVSDLVRARPELLLVLRPDPLDRRFGGARHFDYLAYFSADPALSTLMGDYAAAGVVGSYDVFWRRGGNHAPIAEPPRPPVSIDRAGLREIGEGLSALLLVAGLGVGWWATARRET